MGSGGQAMDIDQVEPILSKDQLTSLLPDEEKVILSSFKGQIMGKLKNVYGFITRYSCQLLGLGILAYAALSIISYTKYNESLFFSAVFRTAEDADHYLLLIPIVISCIGLYGTTFRNELCIKLFAFLAFVTGIATLMGVYFTNQNQSIDLLNDFRIAQIEKTQQSYKWSIEERISSDENELYGTIVWDNWQSAGCCGLDSASDWDSYRPSQFPKNVYPSTCCQKPNCSVLDYPETKFCDVQDLYKLGCREKIMNVESLMESLTVWLALYEICLAIIAYICHRKGLIKTNTDNLGQTPPPYQEVPGLNNPYGQRPPYYRKSSLEIDDLYPGIKPGFGSGLVQEKERSEDISNLEQNQQSNHWPSNESESEKQENVEDYYESKTPVRHSHGYQDLVPNHIMQSNGKLKHPSGNPGLIDSNYPNMNPNQRYEPNQLRSGVQHPNTIDHGLITDFQPDLNSPSSDYPIIDQQNNMNNMSHQYSPIEYRQNYDHPPRYTQLAEKPTNVDGHQSDLIGPDHQSHELIYDQDSTRIKPGREINKRLGVPDGDYHHPIVQRPHDDISRDHFKNLSPGSNNEYYRNLGGLKDSDKLDKLDKPLIHQMVNHHSDHDTRNLNRGYFDANATHSIEDHKNIKPFQSKHLGMDSVVGGHHQRLSSRHTPDDREDRNQDGKNSHKLDYEESRHGIAMNQHPSPDANSSSLPDKNHIGHTRSHQIDKHPAQNERSHNLANRKGQNAHESHHEGVSHNTSVSQHPTASGSPDKHPSDRNITHENLHLDKNEKLIGDSGIEGIPVQRGLSDHDPNHDASHQTLPNNEAFSSTQRSSIGSDRNQPKHDDRNEPLKNKNSDEHRPNDQQPRLPIVSMTKNVSTNENLHHDGNRDNNQKQVDQKFIQKPHRLTEIPSGLVQINHRKDSPESNKDEAEKPSSNSEHEQTNLYQQPIGKQRPAAQRPAHLAQSRLGNLSQAQSGSEQVELIHPSRPCPIKNQVIENSSGIPLKDKSSTDQAGGKNEQPIIRQPIGSHPHNDASTGVQILNRNELIGQNPNRSGKEQSTNKLPIQFNSIHPKVNTSSPPVNGPIESLDHNLSDKIPKRHLLSNQQDPTNYSDKFPSHQTSSQRSLNKNELSKPSPPSKQLPVDSGLNDNIPVVQHSDHSPSNFKPDRDEPLKNHHPIPSTSNINRKHGDPEVNEQTSGQKLANLHPFRPRNDSVKKQIRTSQLNKLVQPVDHDKPSVSKEAAGQNLPYISNKTNGHHDHDATDKSNQSDRVNGQSAQPRSDKASGGSIQRGDVESDYVDLNEHLRSQHLSSSNKPMSSTVQYNHGKSEQHSPEDQSDGNGAWEKSSGRRSRNQLANIESSSNKQPESSVSRKINPESFRQNIDPSKKGLGPEIEIVNKGLNFDNMTNNHGDCQVVGETTSKVFINDKKVQDNTSVIVSCELPSEM